MKEAISLSESLPDEVLRRKLFTIGVADGSAYYVVTKVDKKTCDVEWRGFCPDRYVDHYFGMGRKRVPIEDIKIYLI